MPGVHRGPNNSLIDVPGLRVGHAHRIGDGWRTGVTVVLPPPDGAVAGVDVRGAAPGTRETDLLRPDTLVERVHAIVLCGGSAYGLAAATGVVERLADAGVGYPVQSGVVVPIVPAAVIFDLGRGGLPRATPDAALGAAAYDAALAGSGTPVQGSVGAGAGAQAGGFAGGVGAASQVLPGGVTVAALAVVNAAGSPVDPATGELYATRYAAPGEFGVRVPDPAELAAWLPRTGGPPGGLPPGEPGAPGGLAPGPFNTVIGVVATDAELTKAQCVRFAGAGHDGLARAVRPAHTMTDGDTVFGLATGAAEAPDLVGLNAMLGAAADCFTRAIGHAMLTASGRAGAASYQETFPSAVS
ncbi:MAG: P1 family peptidase [Micromonosporaceae bacterium]